MNEANVLLAQARFDKMELQLWGWLSGRRYWKAIAAMEYARDFHDGTRKDGFTPEFFHQLAIAWHMRTLADSLMHPEETLAAIFLHDLCEDKDVGFEEIEARFGGGIAKPVRLLTKLHRGARTPDEAYYQAIAGCPIASVAKGGDRMHNIQSMVDVFSRAKQESYIAETAKHVIPMLRAARGRFPAQEAAYENIKGILRLEIELIEAIHRASAA